MGAGARVLEKHQRLPDPVHHLGKRKGRFPLLKLSDLLLGVGECLLERDHPVAVPIPFAQALDEVVGEDPVAEARFLKDTFILWGACEHEAPGGGEGSRAYAPAVQDHHHPRRAELRKQ